MVAFTAFVSAISMALLASTASAAPSVVAARQPPTSSAIDFTLYKTTQPGLENMCYTPVDVVHVSPTELVDNGGSSTACNTANFYVAQIDSVAWGWNCQLNVFSDTTCSSLVGTYTYNNNWYPCQFPSSSGLVTLQSWVVNCN